AQRVRLLQRPEGHESAVGVEDDEVVLVRNNDEPLGWTQPVVSNVASEGKQLALLFGGERLDGLPLVIRAGRDARISDIELQLGQLDVFFVREVGHTSPEKGCSWR